MKLKNIEYTEQDQIAIICFNRPHVMNCIDPATHKELVEAWTEFRSNDKLKVAIITGKGDQAFCTGGDLKAAQRGEFVAQWGKDEVKAHSNGERDGFIGPTRWTNIYKPIIAAVNGAAYAGGLEWACFADMRIAEEHASFGVTCRRWNVGLGDGGTQRLPRIIGLGRAMELIITGRVIEATEALSIGLVNEVVPRGQSLNRAIELAETISKLPQPALRSDKEAVYRGLGLSLEDGLKVEAKCFFNSIFEDETTRGLKQFVDRTHPDRRNDRDAITPGL